MRPLQNCPIRKQLRYGPGWPNRSCLLALEAAEEGGRRHRVGHAALLPLGLLLPDVPVAQPFEGFDCELGAALELPVARRASTVPSATATCSMLPMAKTLDELSLETATPTQTP